MSYELYVCMHVCIYVMDNYSVPLLRERLLEAGHAEEVPRADDAGAGQRQ